jgi:hypothetical protein
VFFRRASESEALARDRAKVGVVASFGATAPGP